jgi:hypothetical protein
MVTRFRYYLSSCLENREKMFIVTVCQLLSQYALIMDYSLFMLLSLSSCIYTNGKKKLHSKNLYIYLYDRVFNFLLVMTS